MLNWPEEAVSSSKKIPKWQHRGSNLCLDFHGNPYTAKLVIFSDGNHFMALIEAVELFLKMHPEVEEIFYVTTPPGPIRTLLEHGSLQLGNFILSVKPHVFISPPAVLDNLTHAGYLLQHHPFMNNQGNVLLITKGNPKNISGIADLARKDIRLFLSNPETETVSYKGYVHTLQAMAARENIDVSFLSGEHPDRRVCYGEHIHHREAPQALVDGRADIAVIYYHLALRYTRVFPSLFEFIPLGGTIDNPEPFPENTTSLTHAGLIGDGGQWGPPFLKFLSSDPVHQMYAHHGLVPIKQ